MDATKILEVAAKGAGVLATVALLLSIIHDWGFFWALGMSFTDLPTSMADHIRSGLIWLPGALLALFIGATSELVLRYRLEKGLTEEEIIQSSKNPEHTRRFRSGAEKLLFFSVGPLTVFSFVLLGDVGNGILGFLPIALSLSWWMFSNWVTSLPLAQIRANPRVLTTFYLLPIVFIFMFFVGYGKAGELASKKLRTSGYL